MQAPRPEAHYLEALIRGPRGTIAEAPTILFEYARKKNKEALVDRPCVEAILDAALRVPADIRLGITVHASSLAMDGGFVDFLGAALEARGISPLRLIVEIVEHAPPWDVVSFRAALAGLRRLGARIALDDVGLGHSNYMMICECRPDYLKGDRYFVTGFHRDFHRRPVLASIAHLAGSFRARVVPERAQDPQGVEPLERFCISPVQAFP